MLNLSEKQYYNTVRKWLEKQGYYCGGNITIRGKENYYQDIGTKQRRIDVAGVKNVGNKFEDDIEIVAIEVRDRPVVSDKDISDTAKYHNCVHKCYLGTTAQMTSEIKKYAERANVGLLQLSKDKPPEVLHHSSPRKPEDYPEMIRFLESFEIVKCSICGCFFERFVRTDEGYQSSFAMTRAAYFRAVKDDEKDPLSLKEIKELPSEQKILRYICHPCLEELFINPSRILRNQTIHAYWDKEEKSFYCLVGKEKACADFVYNPEEIVEHLQTLHHISPDNQIIKGWTDEHEKAWEKHSSKTKKK